MSIKIKALDNQFGEQKETFLPKIPFSCYIVAQKKAGKSTLLLNMLLNKELLRNKFNRIIFISPTAKMDEKTQVLKNTDILVKNTLLIKTLKKLREKRKLLDDGEKIPNIQTIEEHPLHLTDDDFIPELSLDFLTELLEYQKSIVEGLNKAVADNVLLVLDDSVMSPILKTKTFSNFIFLSRHFKISVIFISQAYKSLPKPLRLNNSQLILFSISNTEEVKLIYGENNVSLTFKEFYKIYKETTDVSFNFLGINYDNKKAFRLTDGFNKFIQI